MVLPSRFRFHGFPGRAATAGAEALGTGFPLGPSQRDSCQDLLANGAIRCADVGHFGVEQGTAAVRPRG